MWVPNVTDSELLDNSCSHKSLFPNNIVHQTTPRHHLDSYTKRLEEMLEGVPINSREDPRCRFIFPIAAHARE
ncbi:hypothetical protein LSUE1_G004245 [Lachnellula suecica]|uniref:Uncharacterized protein n=1 Tax=Lachnellula suecica TaxID=602035 RepID=A0A8T9C423_9HELO|nr:hypothetical protein LSUE1_G004245 [Lachnellula suecica]